MKGESMNYTEWLKTATGAGDLANRDNWFGLFANVPLP
jgi:hypothetical protein